MPNNAHPRQAPAFILCPLLLLSSCVSDAASPAAGYSHHILPASSTVPEPAARLAQQIRLHDSFPAVSATLTPRQGYLDGSPVNYWDFGPASARPQPAWIFRRRSSQGEPLAFGHPSLVDRVPGEEGYSPFCRLYLVYVKDTYQGEQLTSLAALEDAMEIGLVDEPIALDIVVPWPITRTGAVLALPDSQLLPAITLFYRGQKVSAFALDTAIAPLPPLPPEQSMIAAGSAYEPRRQAEPEPIPNNLVFAADIPTGLWRVTNVVVDNDLQEGEATSSTDFFWSAAEPTGLVIEYSLTDTLHFMPLIHEDL